jgi:hypothetical protein
LCVAHAAAECYSSIQAAVDAATDGDMITIGSGTFDGGITIDSSIELEGAGAGTTVIRGGGPVITIGTLFAPTQPTVSISDITVTGGLTTTKPVGYSVTEGGGVWIPPAEDYATGATVFISDSVITKNRVAPTAVDPPEPGCGPIGCAIANGGGISNSGTLTITNTVISDNAVGPSIAHEAVAGGIRNQPMGTLRLLHSFVTGNRVIAAAPNGILAVGGGISDHGALEILDSVVGGNRVRVEASYEGEAAAWSGAIEVTAFASASIVGATVQGNVVDATNDVGAVIAGDGGISTDPDVSVSLRDTTIGGNSVTARASAPDAVATAISGGLEIQGVMDVRNCRILGNQVRAIAPNGVAIASGGGVFAYAFDRAVVTDTVVAGNGASAATTTGFAQSAGGGVLNGGDLAMLRTVVDRNRATATGPTGLVQGGGIGNGLVEFPGFPTFVRLKMVGSTVSGNSLSGSDGVVLEGGGIFTDRPIKLLKTVVSGNRPDECVGCSTGPAR